MLPVLLQLDAGLVRVDLISTPGRLGTGTATFSAGSSTNKGGTCGGSIGLLLLQELSPDRSELNSESVGKATVAFSGVGVGRVSQLSVVVSSAPPFSFAITPAALSSEAARAWANSRICLRV